MGRCGIPLSGEEIYRIVELLTWSDMSIGEIAERVGCSRSAVASINRKSCIRYYNGRRGVWEKKDGGQPSLKRAGVVGRP